MKLGEFETLFPHVDTEQCAFVNPLDALESHFFSRKAPKGVKLADYRELALDAAREAKVAFSSTTNNAFNLMRLQVKVSCFYCQGDTEVNGGGGSSGQDTITYRCTTCGSETSITTPTGGVFIRPKP